MKKAIKRTIVALCVVLCALSATVGFGGTQNPFSTAVVAHAAVSLNVTYKRVIKGKSFTLKAKGVKGSVKWKSKNPKIATVNAKGVVTAVAKGETDIYVYNGKQKTYCHVIVEAPKLSKKAITLVKGHTAYLSLDGTYQTVKWVTADKTIVAVNQYGMIKGMKNGETVVGAKVGGVTFKCKVKVETPKLSKTELTLIEGNTFTLKLKGNTQKIKWSSNDKTVATVSSKGVVKAISEGYTTIWADIGAESYYCRLTVEKPPVDMKKIHAKYYDTDDGIVAVLSSDFPDCLRVQATVLYYDAAKNLIDTKSETLSTLGTGRTGAIKIGGPRSNSYDRLDYASYDVKLTADRAYHENKELGFNNISIQTTRTADKVIVKATNTGKTKYSVIEIAILFFDADGNCIDYDYSYADCELAGSEGYINFNFPYDDDYNTIVPASFKIYVNDVH